eukprot:2766786-Amphidinium_carterae.1
MPRPAPAVSWTAQKWKEDGTWNARAAEKIQMEAGRWLERETAERWLEGEVASRPKEADLPGREVGQVPAAEGETEHECRARSEEWRASDGSECAAAW